MSNLKFAALAVLLVGFVVCVSCNKQDDGFNEVELRVASSKVFAMNGNGEMAERNVVRELSGEWQALTTSISGFSFELGYEYNLKVRKITPPKDMDGIYPYYELISQLSKEKKETVFSTTSYQVTSAIKVLGENLSTEQIATIENQIKSTSLFNGATGLTLECIDFYITTPLTVNFKYKTNIGKTGYCKFTYASEGMQNINSITFNFKEEELVYKYIDQLFIMDVTDKYKTDYPALESAVTGVSLSKIR